MPDKIFFWGASAIYGLTVGFFILSFIPLALTRFIYWLVALIGTIAGPLSGFWVVFIWYINDYSSVTEFEGPYTVTKIFLHLFLLGAYFLFISIFSSELIDPIWQYYWLLADRATIENYDRPNDNVEDIQFSDRFSDPTEVELNSFLLEF